MEYSSNGKEMLGYMDDGDNDEILVYDDHGKMDLSSDSEDDAESVMEYTQTYPPTQEERINWQEQLRMINLRKHLNQLLDKVKHAQFVTDKTREELEECREKIQNIEFERDRLFREIQSKEKAGKRSAVPRICAAHRRLCGELAEEQELEQKIVDRLEQAEYDLAVAEVERGKFLVAEDDLLEQEHQLITEKTDTTMMRLHKEERLAHQVKVMKRRHERTYQDAVKEAKRRHMQAVEEAEKSHERTNKYLQQTLTKINQRQKVEEERHKADMNKKIEMLLKLRSDISHNRENLRVICARDKAAERVAKLAEHDESERIRAQGGDPEEILIIKKRQNEREKTKLQFEMDQKTKKANIMTRILKEEENMKKRKKLQPYLWDDAERKKSLRVAPHQLKPLQLLENYETDKLEEDDNLVEADNPMLKLPAGEVDDIDACQETNSRKKLLEKLEIETRGIEMPAVLVNNLSLPDNSHALKENVTGKRKPTNNIQTRKSLLSNLQKNKNKNKTEEGEISRTVSEAQLVNNEQLSQENEPQKLHLQTEEVQDWPERGEEDLEHIEEVDKIDIVSVHPITVKRKPVYISSSESDVESDNENDNIDLATPEFQGLWNQETQPNSVRKDVENVENKPIGGSKMEKEILHKVLKETRDRIVVTQVAAGKKFTGCSFVSNPDVIHFKDLEAGKTYTKQVTLTNVSYSLNYIKFVDITDRLKDFIKIQFNPPGQMSAGLTCKITVVFRPVINVDLTGEVSFLTQTGPFNIPLVCSTKKCDLVLDTHTVEFGSAVIGETLKRTFTLTNRGALGTKFEFARRPVDKSRISTVYSLNRMQSWGMSNTNVTELAHQEEFSAKNETAVPTVVSRHESLISKQNSEHSVISTEEDANQMYNQMYDQMYDPMPSRLNTLHVPGIGDSNRPFSPNFSVNRQKSNGEKSMGEKSLRKSMGGASTENLMGNNVASQKTRRSEEALDNIPETDGSSVPSEVVREEAVLPDQGYVEENEQTNQQKNDQELDEGMSTDLGISEIEEFVPLDGMHVGHLVAEEIGPFSSLRLNIIWQPTLPGQVDTEFQVTFADPLSEPLYVQALANAMNIPVWVERPSIDLKICMFDRLYQDTIVINSRASTALRLQFEVCKELKDHLEILPHTGFIQGQSQFSAQIKFMPRKSLFEEAGKYFDKETGVLEAPMMIRVVDQTALVNFTVHAVVTTSDLVFDISDIHFGHCTVHESVRKTIRLTNKSILPQPFGFVGLPEYLEVQPNDGFGTLLPLETLDLDVIFSPRRAQEYKHGLLCRSLINRDFKISTSGVGVLPLLELSHQVVCFAATPLYDVSTVWFHVINSHTSSDESTHPVPRIGKGKICPVGPTSFEFRVPSDAPLTISPCVGTVAPGEKCRIQIRFTPTLKLEDIHQEALRIYAKMELIREEKEREELERQERLDLWAKEHGEDEKKAVRKKGVGLPARRSLKVSKNISKNNPEENTETELSSHSDMANTEKELPSDTRHVCFVDNLLPMKTNQIKYRQRNRTNNRSDPKIFDLENIDEVLSETLKSSKEGLEQPHRSNLSLESHLDVIELPEDEGRRVDEGGSNDSLTKAKLKGNETPNISINSSTSHVAEHLNFNPDKLPRDDPKYMAAQILLRQFKGQFQSLTIPCFVASGKTGNPGELKYSVHNTLYLNVHCPAIKPPLVVLSDGGKRTVDFGDVFISQIGRKSVTIQNITEQTMQLKTSGTNPHGPFILLNALRPLRPESSIFNMQISFAPTLGKIYQEELCINTVQHKMTTTLHLTLRGRGVRPITTLNVEDRLLDMEPVVVGDIREKTFMIENLSTLAIDFRIKQDSLSPLQHQRQQEIPSFIRPNEKITNFVGTQNENGKTVFDIIPTTGTMQAGESKEITLTFAPDHESDFFSDGISIELFDQEDHFFQVIGQAKSQVMYVDGHDLLTPGEESLGVRGNSLEDNKAVLVTVKAVQSGDIYLPGTQKIYAGYVETRMVRSSLKKYEQHGEFSIEGIQGLIGKGFSIEPQKGVVKAGSKKPIVFTWTPPVGFNPSQTVKESALLILRCDVTIQIPLLIRALVVSE